MQISSTYQVTPMRPSAAPHAQATTPFSEPLDHGLPTAAPISAKPSRASEAPAADSTASLGSTVRGHVEAIARREAELEAAFERTLHGDGMNQRELLELQATVYAYGARVEIATRVVDRSVGALRQLLQIQL